MEEDVTTELEWAKRCARSNSAVDWPLVAAILVDRLDEIDRRAQQVRGGVKPYARPPEIADFLLATPPTAPKVGRVMEALMVDGPLAGHEFHFGEGCTPPFDAEGWCAGYVIRDVPGRGWLGFWKVRLGSENE